MRTIGRMCVTVVIAGTLGCDAEAPVTETGQLTSSLTAAEISSRVAALGALVNVTVAEVADLTTQPQRAANAVHPDATALAPAGVASWTPITKAVPGWLVEATVADDPQARFLMRIPHAWNQKLVSAGTPGTRSTYSSDIIISDYVLQKGYAYVTSNKGTGNLATPAIVPYTDPRACPMLPVADVPTRSGYNVFVDFQLLDPGSSLHEWNVRMIQATLTGRDVLQIVAGQKPGRVYAMGLSNGGYQVLRALEKNSGHIFDGAVDWSGVYWNVAGPNLLGELAAGLKHYPAYAASGHDPASPAAQAIRAAGFPPDVTDVTGRLWAVYRKAYWEITQCLYVREIDPGYAKSFVDLNAAEPFAAFAGYDYTSRLKTAGQEISHFANTGKPGAPLIIVHGTLDALVTLENHARAYKRLVEQNGLGAQLRVYEIQNGNHVDGFRPLFPNVVVPIMPRAHEAFDALERWVEQGVQPPPSHCVPKGQALAATTGEDACSQLAAP